MVAKRRDELGNLGFVEDGACKQTRKKPVEESEDSSGCKILYHESD